MLDEILVSLHSGDQCHTAKITNMAGVAKVIREVDPVPHAPKEEQVQRFKENLMIPRKERRQAVETARKLLDS